MVQSKHQFVVKSRLEPSKPFVPLEVRSHFDTLPEAEARMEEWLEDKIGLEKAKPEAIVETEDFAHLADCKKCRTPLFKDDIVFHTHEAKYCYECVPDGIEGYFDLL